MSPQSTFAATRARLTSASWWFRSSDGRLVLWQAPNPALSVWIVTAAIGLLDLSASHATVVAGVRHGALIVWALDEVVRGATPFRRVLGAVVLIGQIASLTLS
jgi:hypothetical protein